MENIIAPTKSTYLIMKTFKEKNPSCDTISSSALNTGKKENKIFLIYRIRKLRGIGCKVICVLLPENLRAHLQLSV